ncbi:hypothetical protein RUA4292_03233 [Ruegeria atlantica]|uniref:Cadherin-like domain-containing protein n=2 Tax=Ruegeria atlantica TaxID=81569 RepID=A0A0P1F3P8_9RHOB|nr:hypothetical protein RUA4292_03233 [Ruegeria atlantica]
MNLTVNDTTPSNDPPDAVDDGLATDEDVALVINVAGDLLANDSDPEGDPISLTGVTQPANGVLTDNGNGTYTYTPNAGFSGADSFTYTISDGNSTDTATVNLTVNDTTPPQSAIISDDFATGTLGSDWEFSGIAGNAYLGATATDGYLQITSPAGAAVSASDFLTTPRVLQDVTDGDFQISAGFLTQPTQTYQEHGLLVVEDGSNFIRFDIAFTSNSILRLIVGVIENGSTSFNLFEDIPYNSVTDFRITRSGDSWLFETSNDGVNWTTASTIEHQMVVSKVGVFAGSAPKNGVVPGYTAQVDYFENTADPIVNEDGTILPVANAPDAVDDGLFTGDDTALIIDVATDLLANDSDPEGDPISLTGVTQPANGVLTDNGNGTYTYTPNVGFNGVDSFTYTISDSGLTDTAEVSIAVGNPIDVWYGLTQSFGSPGEGQERINILGNVGVDVTSMTYSINGGPEQALSVGADGIRLQNEGDFNVDIFYADLDGSATDDIVTLTATLVGGTIVTRDVVIEYEDGAIWDPNYSIDWDAVTNAQDALQIVDGKWSWDGNGIRPVDLGYDRLLVLGDQGWDNYEVNLTIDMHDLQNERGFTFGMLWNGHTDSRYGDIQPLSGWEPGAAFFYTNERFKSHSYHEWSEVLGVTDKLRLQEDVTYNFTVRVEQTGIYDRLYSLKVWEEGTAEPVGWTLQVEEAFSLDEAPATGSLYLNAHYFDVTFGDLTITEITGRDIIQGDDSDEVQVAVDTSSSTPGLGEIDVFVGVGGADTFVFGDMGGAYYDDGVGANAGEDDYGFVYDFTSDTDHVQLAGSAADYVLSTDAPGLSPGTAIWKVGENGDADELIGILNSVYDLDLNSADFIYADTLLV